MVDNIESEIKEYIIIGVGAYLSDIVDIIHANHGKVKKIYQNIPEVARPRVPSIKERIGFLKYPVELVDSLESFQKEDGCAYVLGCITPQKHTLIAHMKNEYDISFTSLIHPHAFLGSNISVGEGVLIGPGVVMAPNIVLEDFCVINRGVNIGHEAVIGKYARLGPGVALAALTKLGEGSSIGIGATVLDRIYIGRWSIIGAGSVVTKDIEDEVVAYGVPSKVIRKIKE